MANEIFFRVYSTASLLGGKGYYCLVFLYIPEWFNSVACQFSFLILHGLFKILACLILFCRLDQARSGFELIQSYWSNDYIHKSSLIIIVRTYYFERSVAYLLSHIYIDVDCFQKCQLENVNVKVSIIWTSTNTPSRYVCISCNNCKSQLF